MNSPDKLYELGVGYFRAGNLDSALETFALGERLFPAFQDRYGHLAFVKEVIRTHLARGDFARAFEKLTTSPGGTRDHAILFARAYAQASEKGAADAWWRIVRAYSPTDPEVLAYFQIPSHAPQLPPSAELVRLRVAVVYFGLARATEVCWPSIRKNLYEVAANQRFDFFSVASLMHAESVTNPRNGEHGVALPIEESLHIPANAYLIVRQQEYLIRELLASAQTRRDDYGNQWASVSNALQALCALRRGLELASSLGTYDYYLFLRPDLLYQDEIHLEPLIAKFVGTNNVALPPWHSWGGYNDRFAFCDAEGAATYANRVDSVLEYCGQRDFHSESFLKWTLAKRTSNVWALPVRARRVRADKRVQDEDFTQTVSDLQ